MPNDQQLWSHVDAYFESVLNVGDPALDATLTASREAGLPDIAVAPNQARLLQVLAQAVQARSILEIGTLGGYSTISLARGLPRNGSLVTLEVNPATADVARENIARAGHADQVDIRVGPAVETLERLVDAGHPPFDLVFIDANKQQNPDYLRLALQLSRPGTLIICDNVVRNGRVADADATDSDVAGVRQYLNDAGSHSGLLSAAIQTVGSKGYDGLSLTIVQNPPGE